MKHAITDGRKRRGQANKQSILKAARDIFLEKGYTDNSMMEISRRAGVGYGTLYSHFEGKEDIMKHLIDDISDDFSRLVNLPYTPESARDVENRIAQEISYVLKLAKKHHPLLRVTYEAMGQSESIREHWEGIFKQYVDKSVEDYSYSIEKGLARGDLDRRIVAQSNVYMIKEFFWAVVLEKEDDIEKISRTVAALFVYGAYH